MLVFGLSTSLKTRRNTTNLPGSKDNLKTNPEDVPFFYSQIQDRSTRSVTSMDDIVNPRRHFLLYNGVVLPLKTVPVDLASHSTNSEVPSMRNSGQYLDKQITEDEIKPLNLEKKKKEDTFKVLLNNVRKLRNIAANVERQLSMLTISNLKRNKKQSRNMNSKEEPKTDPSDSSYRVILPEGDIGNTFLNNNIKMGGRNSLKVSWSSNQLQPAAQKPFSDFKLRVTTTVANSNGSDLGLTSESPFQEIPFTGNDDTNKTGSELNISTHQKELPELLLDQLKGSKYYDMSVSDSIYSDIKGLSALVASARKLENHHSDAQAVLPEPGQSELDLTHRDTPLVNLNKRSKRSRRSLIYRNPIFQNVFSHSDLSTQFADRFFEASKPVFPIYVTSSDARQPCLKIHHDQKSHIHDANFIKLETTTKLIQPNDLLLPSPTKIQLPLPITLQLNAKKKLITPKLPNLTKKYNFTLTPSLNRTLNIFWSLPSKKNPVIFNTSTDKHAVSDQIKTNITKTEQNLNQSNTFKYDLHNFESQNELSYLPKVLQEEIKYTSQFAHGNLQPSNGGVKLLKVTTPKSSVMVDIKTTTLKPSIVVSSSILPETLQENINYTTHFINGETYSSTQNEDLPKLFNQTHVPSINGGYLKKNKDYPKVLKYNTLGVNVTTNFYELNFTEMTTFSSLPTPLEDNINYTVQFFNVNQFNASTPPPAAAPSENNFKVSNYSKPSDSQVEAIPTSSFKHGNGGLFVRVPPHKAKNFTFNSPNSTKNSGSKGSKHHNLVVYHLKNPQVTSRPSTRFVNQTVTNVNNLAHHSVNRSDIPVENADENLVMDLITTENTDEKIEGRKVLTKIIKRPISKTNTKNLVVSLLKSERLASM